MQVNRKNIATALFVLCMGGMLWSRALLSIATLLLGAGVFFFVSKKNRSISLTPLHGWSILAIVFFCMGVYEGERDDWGDIITPLLQTWLGYFAIASGGLWMRYFSLEGQWKKIWIMAAAIAAAIPLSWLIIHPIEALERIKIGKTLPVPMDGDHIRFSIFIASALLLSLTDNNQKIKRYASLFFIATLLLLSVRTGIVLGAVVVIGQLIIDDRRWTMDHRKKAIVYGLWSMIFLLSLPFLYQKLNYTIYDWQQFNAVGYNPNYSDGVRRALNHAATQCNVPIGGIGWNQITPILSKTFHSLYHTPPPFGWPFNQFLFWWMGIGIIGAIMYAIWLFYPIWYGYKTKQYTICIWSIAISLTCLTETTLNYQFGVFLHLWPLLLATKSTQRNNL